MAKRRKKSSLKEFLCKNFMEKYKMTKIVEEEIIFSM